MAVVKVESVGNYSLDRVNKLLAGIPGGAYKAAYSALKRASGKAKTEAGRYAAEHYTITKGTFMSNVSVKERLQGESGSVANATILFGGSVLPLLSFSTKYSKGGLLTTQVMRNGGAATLEHAFAEKVFGPIAVFERTGKERFPVRQLYGPSTGHMMQNEEVSEEMGELIERTYNERIEHEILRVLNGW